MRDRKSYQAAGHISGKFDDLWLLVGNTPMVEILYEYKGIPGKIYAKCEHYNLTGSIKDRMALHILHQAYLSGSIAPDDTIIEATSGNTGIAFAAIGRALGHDVKIIMPDWLSQERMDIIRSMGAEIITVSKEQGGFQGSIRIAGELAAKGGVFLPCQFENQANVEAHRETTGKEIWWQLASREIIPDAFVAGVGTGGTVMGVGSYLRGLNPGIGIHPLEPAESPTLSTGFKSGTHRIQGISDEFIPSIVNLNQLDDVIQANDGDAIITAQKLARELGLAVGISSGANVIGAIKLSQRLGPDASIVTLLCDSNKKYLSTALVRDEPAMENYISTGLRFTGFNPISRLSDSFRYALANA